MMRRFGSAVAVLGLAVGGAQAQTNDHFFRSWSWRTEVGAPRPMGLGGAFVAMAGDPASAWLNPAGLTGLQGLELGAGGMLRRSGTTAIADSWASRTGLGYVGGGSRLAERWAIGGYLIEPHAADISLFSTPLADGTRDSGSLRTIVTEVGGAVAYRVGSRVSLGARVTLTHLELEGLWEQWQGETQSLRVGSGAGQSRLTGSFGAQFEVSEELRLGVLGDTGASYEADRTAVSPTLGDLDVGGKYDVRQPARVSAGATWKASNKVRLVGQVDFVRYGEIQTSIRHGAGKPAEYALEDAVEPRGGIELSLPVATWWSVQLRGGVHYRGASGPKYSGAEGGEKSAWMGEAGGLEGSAGVALVGRVWRIEVAGVVGGLRSAATVGLTLRR